MDSVTKKIIWTLVVLGLLAGMFWLYHVLRPVAEPKTDITFGATFSKKYAAELGLNWKDVYLSVLQDLPIETLRIPAYWDEIEPQDEIYNFAELDWQLEQAAAHDKQVILAIGRKLPRWPECHIPSWAMELRQNDQKAQVYDMISRVVQKYEDNPTIVAWQIENEPLFLFGDCPLPSWTFLRKEVDVVKNFDRSRPVIITDSGEFSTWLRTSLLADVLGISMYRVSYTPLLGYTFYPMKPFFYSDHAWWVRQFVDRILVTELQVEPWVTKPVVDTPMEEQYVSMNADLMRENFDFAARTGFDEILVWGVEWWYWLRQQGDDTMWELGKSLLQEYSQGQAASL